MAEQAKNLSVSEARSLYDEAKSEEHRAFWEWCESQSRTSKAKNALIEAMAREGIDEDA